MDARSPNPGGASRPQLIDPDRERSRPKAIELLQRLIGRLFSESNSLDIVTIEDIVLRYPLTKLGAPASAAIEQSRRIVRARTDNSQAGLAEFHIGLIYMYWNECRIAAQQFILARQTWSLAKDAPAICLSHFSQGLALYYAYNNEGAMIQLSRAERMLKRPMVGIRGARMSDLAREMQSSLNAYQNMLRGALWPEEERPKTPDQYLTDPPLGDCRRDENVIYGQPPAGGAAPSSSPVDDAHRAFERPPRLSDDETDVPLPYTRPWRVSPEGARGPVPGHVSIDDRFGWYQIAEKKSGFIPEVVIGSLLLADREVDERLLAEYEYVVVGSRRMGLGSITVRPISHSSADPHCYFGYRVVDATSPSGARLYLDETKNPLASDEVHVLAVVEGYWNVLNGLSLAEV
jgi:hypothetical protein